MRAKITFQSIFNAAWQKFIVEDAPPAHRPIKEGGGCFYKMEDGRKCAVGLVLPEGHPSQEFWGPASDVAMKWPELFAEEIHEDYERIDRFQNKLHDALAHDGVWADPKEEREQFYREVAKEYNLTIPE